jgi:phage terminase large subunit
LTESPKIRIEIHPKFQPLLDTPHTFASISGGRGGMKSEQTHKVALQDAIRRPMRVCCARETMASIRDSSHKTLSDIIYSYSMAKSQNGPYEVQESRIIRREGDKIISEFIFVGIRENVRDQKSLKGINRTIVEEAAKLSQDSLDVFVPTVVREEGSQIWFIWNDEMVDDPLYKMMKHHPPSNTIHIRTSYLDNPWLSKTMRQLAEDCKRDFPAKYRHIWLGEPISSIEGAVYAQEIQQAEEKGQFTKVPYDPSRPVETYWDLGYGDMVSIWFVQAFPFQFRVIDYYENTHQAIDHYLQVLQRKGYVYGPCVLPWDGGAKHLGTGKSIEELIRAKGFKARVIPQAKVADGINAVRTIFPQCWFDADNCEQGLKGLRRYQWGPPSSSGVLRREPLHDEASHPADALRTMAMSIKAPVTKNPQGAAMPMPVTAWS